MKKILTAILLTTTALWALAAEPVTLIMPIGSGGMIHKYAIDLQPVLMKMVGAPVVFDFKPGARGLIGAQALARSTGPLTLMLGPVQNFAEGENPSSFSQLNDIVPIAYMGTIPGVVVALPKLGVANLREALVLSRSKPLSYGIPAGAATLKLFRDIAKKHSTPENFLEIPYKSGAPIVVDVLGGQLDIGSTVLDTTQQYIDSGRLVALAVLGAHRSRLVPNVPTIKELGIGMPDEIKSYNNVFLWASKSSDPDRVADLRRELATFMESTESEALRNRLDLQFGKWRVDQPSAALMELFTP